MWISEGRLAHVLPPSAYTTTEEHARELAHVWRPGWHAVATRSDLACDGAFVRRELFGERVLVRNKGGALEAGPLRVAVVGALVFVSFAPNGRSLEEHFGSTTIAHMEAFFPSDRSPILDATIDHPCNWKIPIENVLESYHVPFLHDNALARHPEIFRVFGGRRDGGAIAHALGERSTSYYDSLGADSRAYRALIGFLRPGASVDYIHHHAFPNMVLGRTSIVSYLQIVEPLSPTTSRSTVRLFLDAGGRRTARMTAAALAPIATRLLGLVMAEDAAVYPAVQRGLAASRQRGVLGSREERIHHFQAWLERQGLGAGAIPFGHGIVAAE